MKSFLLSERLRSFRYAFNGLWVLLKTQHNAWIHLIATVAVIGAGFFFGIRRDEWCWLVIAIAGVWTAEAFNTALEFLADAVHPEKHPLVGKAKDAAAGAVLISAIGSVAIGLLIFGSYVAALFQ
ncbi:diacylglycerol kinase family protein [Pontiellaceae bacterium B12227]|nr:diacylglycerol kinase family protein [Pontiellaceae bacterium B12227]